MEKACIKKSRRHLNLCRHLSNPNCLLCPDNMRKIMLKYGAKLNEWTAEETLGFPESEITYIQHVEHLAWPKARNLWRWYKYSGLALTGTELQCHVGALNCSQAKMLSCSSLKESKQNSGKAKMCNRWIQKPWLSVSVPWVALHWCWWIWSGLIPGKKYWGRFTQQDMLKHPVKLCVMLWTGDRVWKNTERNQHGLFFPRGHSGSITPVRAAIGNAVLPV